MASKSRTPLTQTDCQLQQLPMLERLNPIQLCKSTLLTTLVRDMSVSFRTNSLRTFQPKAKTSSQFFREKKSFLMQSQSSTNAKSFSRMRTGTKLTPQLPNNWGTIKKPLPLTNSWLSQTAKVQSTSWQAGPMTYKRKTLRHSTM